MGDIKSLAFTRRDDYVLFGEILKVNLPVVDLLRNCIFRKYPTFFMKLKFNLINFDIVFYRGQVQHHSNQIKVIECYSKNHVNKIFLLLYNANINIISSSILPIYKTIEYTCSRVKDFSVVIILKKLNSELTIYKIRFRCITN